jgi:phosphodiesterase/alkaline phosphatase D-like protein
VATTTVTLNGNLTALGTATSVSVSFEWKESGGSYTPIAVGVKDSTGTFSVGLTGLAPGTTYYFKAKADGDGDPVYGAENNFTTGITLPTVATDDASNVATTTVTLNGNLTALGTADNVTVSFEWKASGGSYAPIAVGVRDSTGTFSVGLTGLAPGTTYYFKAKADGDGDPVFGTEKSFTTSSLPDSTTPVISSVNSSSITVSGATITWSTNEPATSQIEYGLTEEYGSTTTLDATKGNSHSVEMTDLKAGKTYHYRVISKDAANNEKVSDDFTFTTASRSGGMPAWAWVLIGLGLVAATSGLLVLSRVAGKKPQTSDAAPQ